MHRRAILLMILLALLVVLYAAGVRQSGSVIRAKEKVLLEQLNQLDEQSNQTSAEQE